MPDDHAFFRSIVDSGQHRPGGRAIIFDSTRQNILVEKNLGAREKYVNFPGGGKNWARLSRNVFLEK